MWFASYSNSCFSFWQYNSSFSHVNFHWYLLWNLRTRQQRRWNFDFSSFSLMTDNECSEADFQLRQYYLYKDAVQQYNGQAIKIEKFTLKLWNRLRFPINKVWEPKRTFSHPSNFWKLLRNTTQRGAFFWWASFFQHWRVLHQNNRAEFKGVC